jgi:hypothetical protein
MKRIGLFGLVLLVAGCTATRPLKPGTSAIRSKVGVAGMREFASEMKQPENPAQSAAQNFERTTETELPLASGTRMVETVTAPPATVGQAPIVSEKTIVLAQPAVQRTRVTEKAGTVIGGAQKDTARELAARLGSLKGIVWVGLGLFVFGLVSLFYPPLRAVIGSVTTSIAITGGGVALMILPTLVVGHELFILGGVCLAVGAWFLAHRHGQLRGLLDASASALADPADAAGKVETAVK